MHIASSSSRRSSDNDIYSTVVCPVRPLSTAIAAAAIVTTTSYLLPSLYVCILMSYAM